MRYKYKQKRVTGASLLEILVALAIMAISVVIIYRAIGSVIKATQKITDNSQVQIIANSLLDRYQYVGVRGINENSINGDFQWRVLSEPFLQSEENKKVSLFILRINISNNRDSWVFETLRPAFIEKNKEALR